MECKEGVPRVDSRIIHKIWPNVHNVRAANTEGVGQGSCSRVPLVAQLTNEAKGKATLTEGAKGRSLYGDEWRRGSGPHTDHNWKLDKSLLELGQLFNVHVSSVPAKEGPSFGVRKREGECLGTDVRSTNLVVVGHFELGRFVLSLGGRKRSTTSSPATCTIDYY